MASIYKHLRRTLPRNLGAVLKDPRRSVRRWDFSFLLGHLVGAMLSGCKNLRELEMLTGSIGKRIPDTSVHDLLVQIDPKPLKREIACGVKEAARSHELDERGLPIHLTVIDGKCVSATSYPVDQDSIRRTQKGCEKYVHMFLRAFYASSPLKLLMGQRRIPKGTNERGAFAAFLEELVMSYGRTKLLEVVSLDAGITSKKNAALITQHGLQYIMALKDPRTRKAVPLRHSAVGSTLRSYGGLRKKQSLQQANQQSRIATISQAFPLSVFPTHKSSKSSVHIGALRTMPTGYATLPGKRTRIPGVIEL